MAKKEYYSDDIVVTYDVKRCIHAAECIRGLPAVFDTKKRPWIQPDQAQANDVAEVIMRCPSGALHFERRDGGGDETIPTKNTIHIDPNGALYVQGNIEIMTSDGDLLLEDTRVALCRCGASENKPFCDNNHLQIGFQASGELGENWLAQDEIEDGDSKLKITVAKNGPLLLEGQVEIFNADGTSSCTGSKGDLCRCGGSSNRPFCDNTHKRIGFEAA